MVEKWRNGAKFVICHRISRDDTFVSKVYAELFYQLLHRLVMSDYPDGGYDAGLMDRALSPHAIHKLKEPIYAAAGVLAGL